MALKHAVVVQFSFLLNTLIKFMLVHWIYRLDLMIYCRLLSIWFYFSFRFSLFNNLNRDKTWIWPIAGILVTRFIKFGLNPFHSDKYGFTIFSIYFFNFFFQLALRLVSMLFHSICPLSVQLSIRALYFNWFLFILNFWNVLIKFCFRCFWTHFIWTPDECTYERYIVS